MTTETIIIKRKARNGHNLDLQATVTREPATLNEAAAKRPRWYLEVGPENILSAEVVGVCLDFASCPSPEQYRHWNYYLEIKTATGRGIVFLGYKPDGSCADHGADLSAFVPEGKGTALVWGVYVSRKHGHLCGSPMAYVTAMKRGTKTCCGAEIYNRLAGKGWGSV